MNVQIPRSLPELLQRTQRVRGALPAWASVVLTLLTALAAAQLLWLLVPTPESARWRPAPATPVETASRGGPDVERVASASLFGHYEPEAPAASSLADAPDTRLNLKLLGIYAAEDDEKSSRALISGGSDDDRPYAVGDAVTKGVTIKAIYADRVMLARAGQLEVLRMDKDSPLTGVPAARGRTVPGRPAAGDEESSDGGSLSDIREELINNPAKASDYIRVQPQNSGGVMRGYRIYPGRDRAIFNNAGLRPGDLVTSVNGVQLDDPARALQLLNDLSQATSLSLTIERGGQQQSVTLDLN
jgi:general secretion pathway protein C